MDITPILTAPTAIQFHVIAAMIAVIAGPVALWRRRRDRLHRYTGYGFVIGMLVAATSAMFIHEIRVFGPFSPIHLFVPLTFWGLWRGVTTIRAGNVAAHKAGMRNLFHYGLGIPLVLSFIPGRTMNDILFAAAPNAGFAAVVMSATVFVIMKNRKATMS